VEVEGHSFDRHGCSVSGDESIADTIVMSVE
jgi:hypothetical protein